MLDNLALFVTVFAWVVFAKHTLMFMRLGLFFVRFRTVETTWVSLLYWASAAWLFVHYFGY